MSDSEEEIINNFGSDSESDHSSESSESSSDSEEDRPDPVRRRQEQRQGRGQRNATSAAGKPFIILLKNKYSHTSHKVIPYSLETIENPTICKNSILELNNDILNNDFMIIKKEIERKSKLVNNFTDEQMCDMIKDYYNFFKNILPAEELK